MLSATSTTVSVTLVSTVPLTIQKSSKSEKVALKEPTVVDSFAISSCCFGSSLLLLSLPICQCFNCRWVVDKDNDNDNDDGDDDDKPMVVKVDNTDEFTCTVATCCCTTGVVASSAES